MLGCGTFKGWVYDVVGVLYRYVSRRMIVTVRSCMTRKINTPIDRIWLFGSNIYASLLWATIFMRMDCQVCSKTDDVDNADNNDVDDADNDDVNDDVDDADNDSGFGSPL